MVLIRIINASDSFQKLSDISEKKGSSFKISRKDFEDAYYPGFYQEYNPTKEVFRVCSLTERNDSTIMWSHYANLHMGVCIEYPTSGFSLEEPILPIKYGLELSDFGNYADNDTKALAINLFDLLTRKALDWQYEKEWRILYLKIGKHNKDQPIFIKTPKPTAVYLGSRFEENNKYKKGLLRKICDREQIPVYQMRLDYNEYKMITGK